MITRATDATFINAVMNHPAVRPHIHATPDQQLDMTPVVANPNHVVLTGAFGGMILIQHVRGLYELHTQVLPEGRGGWALDMARECVDWLFCHTNATEVFTRVPKGNVAAKALTMACGAKLEETCIQNLNGQDTEVQIWGGRIQDWIKTAPHLIERGRTFHSRLHAKYIALGLDIKVHAEDDWHDRHVGAAVGMFLGGQPIKGMLIFNRWAAMAMAPMMSIISADPLVLDISESRIEVIGNDFDVIPKGS